MATTIADIREGLTAAIVAGVSGANCTGYMHASGTPPLFEIEVDTIDYHASMGAGYVMYQFVVRGLVNLGSDVGAQVNLDTYMNPSGTNSLKAAIEADKTLGGVVDTLKVTNVTRTAVYSAQQGQTSYLGAEWAVEVYARSS